MKLKVLSIGFVLFFLVTGGSMLFSQSISWKTMNKMYDQKSYSYYKYWQKYPEITHELVMEIPKDKLLDVITDYCAFVIGDSYGKESDNKLVQIPELMLKAYLVYSYEAEINNGGLHQYFFNFTGYYVKETIAALEYFGLNKNAELLHRAYSLVKNKINENEYKYLQEERELPINELFEEFGVIDDEFYKYEEQIDEVVINIIDDNRISLVTKK